jgi:hypothetical protein
VSNLNDFRSELAGKLTAAGVDGVSLDPRVTPPAVLLDAPTVVRKEGVGGWLVEYPVLVLAVPPGNAEALEWQLEQVELILANTGAAGARPTTFDLAGGESPGYSVTVTQFIDNPNC